MRYTYPIFRLAFVAVLVSLAGTGIAADIRPVSVSPEDGFINTPITKVVLDFSSEYTDIRFSERALLYYDPSELVDKEGIIYFGGDEIEQSKDMYSAEISGTQVIFTPKKTWDIYGKYTLMIPEGALIFTNENGKQSANDQLVYIWKYGILPNPFTTPATGEVDNLETLTLQLPEGFCFSSGYPIMSKFLPRVYLSNANGDMLEEAGYYGSVLNSDSWKGSDRIIYTDLTFTPENNEYYLIRFLPGILFLKDTDETMTSAEASLEMNFLYHYVRKSSAVTSPEGDALLDVHSIDGLRRKVERLDQLPRGLWIVNGKKIIL